MAIIMRESETFEADGSAQKRNVLHTYLVYDSFYNWLYLVSRRRTRRFGRLLGSAGGNYVFFD